MTLSATIPDRPATSDVLAPCCQMPFIACKLPEAPVNQRVTMSAARMLGTCVAWYTTEVSASDAAHVAAKVASRATRSRAEKKNRSDVKHRNRLPRPSLQAHVTLKTKSKAGVVAVAFDALRAKAAFSAAAADRVVVGISCKVQGARVVRNLRGRRCKKMMSSKAAQLVDERFLAAATK